MINRLQPYKLDVKTTKDMFDRVKNFMKTEDSYLNVNSTYAALAYSLGTEGLSVAYGAVKDNSKKFAERRAFYVYNGKVIDLMVEVEGRTDSDLTYYIAEDFTIPEYKEVTDELLFDYSMVLEMEDSFKDLHRRLNEVNIHVK